MAIKIIYPARDTTIFSSSKAPPKSLPGGFFSGSVYANAGAAQVLKLSKTIDSTMSASSGLRTGDDGYPINLDRILIKFDLSSLSSSLKTNTDNPPTDGGTIGAEAEYFLKMYNATSPKQVAKSFTTNTHLILSRSWDEGTGLDVDKFRDPGYANWTNPTSTASWHTGGLGSGSAPPTSNPDADADYLNYYSGSNKVITASFDIGTEDMEINITPLVQPILSGSAGLPNLGFLVKLGHEEEINAKDYSEKLFFSSDTHTIYSPRIIVKYDDFIGDDRGYMLTDTPNRLYINHSKRGQLKDIKQITFGPTSTNRNMTSYLTCSIYSGNLSGTLPHGRPLATLSGGGDYLQDANLTCSRTRRGIYQTPLFQMSKSYLSGSGSGKFFDVWYNTKNASANFAITRSFILYTDDNYTSRVSLSPYELTTAIPGLQEEYRKDYDTDVRLDVYVRRRGRSLDDPSRNTMYLIYTGSYEIIDQASNEPIIEFDDTYSRLSYDVSGSYFHLDMSSFDRNRTYEMHFRYKVDGTIVTDNSHHRFRII